MYKRQKTKKSSSFKANIVWKDFDHDTANKLWDLHIKDPTASQCREFILSYLGTEIEFKLNDETIHPTPEFEVLLKSEWSKFIRDVFDSVFIMGICPVKFVRSSSDLYNDFYPVVLKKGLYKIQVGFLIETETLLFRVLRPIEYFFDSAKSTTDPEKRSEGKSGIEEFGFNELSGLDFQNCGMNFQKSGFSIYDTNEIKNRKIRKSYKDNIPPEWVLDRNAVILHGFGYDPEVNGQLTSRLRTILEYQEFTVLQGRMMVLNQARLLSRPLFMKNNEGVDPLEKNATLELNSTLHRREMKKQQQLADSKREMDALSAFFHNNTIGYLLASPQGPAKKVMSDSQNWGGTLSQVLLEEPGPPVSVIDLPKGYDLPPGQKPDITLGMRFFDCEDKLDEKTCASYGVLIDLIKNRGIHKNSATQSEFFQKTLSRWMVILQEILTFCYSAIYGKQDREDLIAEQLEIKNIDNLKSKIEKHIITEWKQNDGIMTKLENKPKKRKHSDDDSKETTLSDDDDSGDSKKDKKKKDKKSKKTNNVEDGVSIFDPSIQTDANLEEKDKKNMIKRQMSDTVYSPLKGIKEVGNVRVSLSFNSALMIDLFAFMYSSGALLDKEYWSALRHHLGYSVDDKTIAALKKQMIEKIGMESPGAASSSASSSKPKPNKPKVSSPDKPKNTLSKQYEQSVLGDKDNAGKKTDVYARQKEKRKKSLTTAKESNVKRKISARKHQALNVEQGKKNKEKTKKATAE